MVKKRAAIVFFVFGVLLLAGVVLAQIEAQRYYPDPDRLFPPPGPRAPSPTEQPRVIEADQIVLRGQDVQIVITASGTRPGITMTHRTGYSQQLYFQQDGKAVIGIRTPGQTHFSAALWATDDFGVLQMRDARGTYTMQPHELHAPGVSR